MARPAKQITSVSTTRKRRTKQEIENKGDTKVTASKEDVKFVKDLMHYAKYYGIYTSGEMPAIVNFVKYCAKNLGVEQALEENMMPYPFLDRDQYKFK